MPPIATNPNVNSSVRMYGIAKRYTTAWLSQTGAHPSGFSPKQTLQQRVHANAADAPTRARVDAAGLRTGDRLLYMTIHHPGNRHRLTSR
jgi:hypothetical protein